MSAVFLRTAGGKRRLLPAYSAWFPQDFTGVFFEPMCGGAALTLDWHLRWLGGAVLGDLNRDLVQVYNHVMHLPEDVCRHLELLVQRYTALDADGQGVMYLDTRRIYNSWPRGGRVWDAESAARYIFLSRTSFNGLYRENAAGEFNVPWGHVARLPAAIFAQIREAGRRCRGLGATLYAGDYEGVVGLAKAGDLVYLDPPYHGTFSSYTMEGFGDEAQRRLALVAAGLVARGVHVRISNADTPLVREAYHGMTFVHLMARRSISRDGNGRRAVRELLIVGEPGEAAG